MSCWACLPGDCESASVPREDLLPELGFCASICVHRRPCVSRAHMSPLLVLSLRPAVHLLHATHLRSIPIELFLKREMTAGPQLPSLIDKYRRRINSILKHSTLRDANAPEAPFPGVPGVEVVDVCGKCCMSTYYQKRCNIFFTLDLQSS